jgi:hypothetical protein
MPTPLSADLPYEALRAGWQKVADRYAPMCVHVFRLADGRLVAVTNRAQGLGEFVETIAPTTDAEGVPQPSGDAHGIGAYAGLSYHEGSGT